MKYAYHVAYIHYIVTSFDTLEMKPMKPRIKVIGIERKARIYNQYPDEGEEILMNQHLLQIRIECILALNALVEANIIFMNQINTITYK